jgi:hypothetical protein
MICSGLWLASISEYYATSALKSDWSATPLFWVQILMITPAVCFAICIVLVETRKQARFSRLVWCALVAALLPVSLGTVLAIGAVKFCFQ